MDQSLINKIRENTDIVEFIGKYIPTLFNIASTP